MFSEDEVKVAEKILVPKTLEEIVKETGFEEEKVKEILAKFDRMGLLKKGGKPQKFVLIEYIQERLDVKEEYPFEFVCFIEATGFDKTSVENSLNFLKEKIEKEPLQILESELGEPIENEGMWTGYIHLRASAKTFRDIVYFIFNYGPSSLELLKPNKHEFSMEEMHDILNDIAGGVHHYISYIGELMMKQKQTGGPQ
jgi:hypothetical protein